MPINEIIARGGDPSGRRLASLRWKLNRLQVMGGLEIFWRVRQSAHLILERFGIDLATRIHAPQGRCGNCWLTELPTGIEPGAYCHAAERILSGRFDIFSLRDVELGFPPNWNRDPRTGTEAPMCFGKTLNYRQETLIGDIKYLWEPNRHLEIITLAQAFSLTGDERFAEGTRALLESWFEQCPYPMGPNWTSSLEHAVRLVNWSYAWHLLGGEESLMFLGEKGAQFKRNWLDCVFRHLHFIHGHFSRYSSANNHLLGEYMGLFVGSVTWPLWTVCTQWRDLARHGFEQEALRQNYSDGVNREQAVWYHHEVADMMLHCGLVGRANGIEFSTTYWERLASMLEFVASIMDVAGHMPMFGDSDDAVMVRFSQEKNFDVYRSLLATGAVLFNRGDFKVKAMRFDDKSRWLLGDAAEKQFDALPGEGARLPVRQNFPEGGYWILGDNFETTQEVRLVADAGSLGYLSIAAHGHADALSFTLSVNGHEILADQGTYAYHTKKAWRDYFRGTSAHNTVRIDGVDQSVPGGSFLWLRHANARCTVFETGGAVERWAGEHDGYLRLDDPVIHHRAITFDRSQRVIKVRDLIKCNKKHKVEVIWHFAETCAVAVVGNGVTAVGGRSKVQMRLEGQEWVPQYMEGSENPLQGWISRRYDEKQPAPCVVWSGNISGTTELVTELQIQTDG